VDTGVLALALEPTFNEFVKSFGGELIEEMLPNNDGRKRADYLFRSPLIVAELKSLERDLDMRAYGPKLTSRMNDWTRRGLMPRIYATGPVDIRNLPKRCQDEWLELHEAPIQKHILSDANKQIREAKESLGLPEAKGVVLIANERQFFSPPADLLTFIARILNKKKSDGHVIYSSIHHVVLFTVNVKIASPEFPQGIFAWLAGYRSGENDAARMGFLNQLGTSWMQFCAGKRGGTHSLVELGKARLGAMNFVPPKSIR
jgi:hypothetical protein